MDNKAQIEEQALVWHRAVLGNSIDWDAFTLWLEASPEHVRAYDGVEMADALLSDHADELAAGMVPDEQPIAQPRRWWLPLGLAVAASLGAGLWWQGGDILRPAEILQSTNQPRQVALADGTAVLLAPYSRLERRGQAFTLTGDGVFDVPHRPGRQMAITAGDLTIHDIGTRFELGVEPAGVRLTVAEGELAVSAPGLASAVSVKQGQALLFRPATASLTLSAAPPVPLGGWQTGQLTYQDTPLPLVVADIARYGGGRVELDRRLADRRFSGSLLIGHGHSPAQDIARLLGLEWQVHTGASADGRLLPAGGR